MSRNTPLKILDIVMLHQMPLRARGVSQRNSAMGIRSAVNTMLITEGGIVRP